MSRLLPCRTYVLLGSVLALAALATAAQVKYPKTRRVPHSDVYHGVEVADPYRWLEDDVRESQKVAAWVEAQNEVSKAYLKRIPQRQAIKRRLTELWDYERYSSPFKAGGRYYYYKNDGLQDHSVLYMMQDLEAEPQVLIDPNTWSEDGSVSLAGVSFSDDGKYVAYGLAEGGSDWRSWRILEIESARLLDDALEWLKFSAVSWTKDGRGFFYSRYDTPEEAKKFQSTNYDQKVFYHRVGTSQSEDVLVYRRPDHPEWGFDAHVTEDGRYLVITIWKGTDDKYRILYRDLNEPYAMPLDLIDSFDNEYTLVGNDGPVFLFKTDLDASKCRVIAIDTRHPQRESWREIIPELDTTLINVKLVANMLVATHLEDAVTKITMYTLKGELVREVAFPTIGSASGFGGKRTDTETFYSFSSFTTPPSIYRYDMLSGKSTLLRRAEVDFDSHDYQVEQVFYPSKDGTRVPMFIAHKKGLRLDGSNPTLLYGYGGFNISQKPHFSITRLAWMELGGVFALANLRGGGEYGEAWHKAGTKLQKQNVFDDFVAAGEYLIDAGYTRPSKLAIEGRSNGGLLVGAVMTQRPELFAACLPGVGVMDMLRFHTFTAGRFWVDDYGSSEDPEEFRALLAYSPYHNLKPGKEYPATLVTTADTDDRVVPGHSFKFAAALQHAQTGGAPVLIRIETRAGHGSGTPTQKRIEKTADEYAFLVKNLGMSLAPNRATIDRP